MVVCLNRLAKAISNQMQWMHLPSRAWWQMDWSSRC